MDLIKLSQSDNPSPPGVGSRRIEVSEEHKIFTASTVFFRAGEGPAIRRNASIGPGLAVHHDDDEVDERSRPPSRGGAETPTREDAHPPVSRGRDMTVRDRQARHASFDMSNFQRDFVSHEEGQATLPTPPYTPQAESPHFMRPGSSSRSSHMLSPTSRGDDPAHTLEEFRNALRALEVEQKSGHLRC